MSHLRRARGSKLLISFILSLARRAGILDAANLCFVGQRQGRIVAVWMRAYNP
jgi:hypothetical protein